jgi:hypothetical protein
VYVVYCRRWAVLFADGEQHYLAAIIDGLSDAMYDLFKSSAECSPTEAAMDMMRSFAIIHQFMRSDEFVRLLQTPDKDITSNGLQEMADSCLQEMDPSSRRVISRFFLSWDGMLDKAYTVTTVGGGWRAAHFKPFSQEGVYDNSPAYENLPESSKDELAFLMPLLISKVLRSGVSAPTDDQIFEVVGHIVGRPNRDKDQEKGGKLKRRLETMAIGRGRAGFYTAEGMKKALADRQDYKVGLENDRLEKKLIKETVKNTEKLKKQSNSYKLGMSRQKRGSSFVSTQCENCFRKVEEFPSLVLTSCSTCPRKWCSSDLCLAEYSNIHFPKCVAYATKVNNDLLLNAQRELDEEEEKGEGDEEEQGEGEGEGSGEL